MNIRSLIGLWAMIMAVFMSAMTSSAKEPQLAASSVSAFNYDSRISELEAELASLRHELQPVVGCEETTCADCCDCACSPGFYSGVAVVFAKPHFKEAFQISLVNTVGQQTLVPFSYDYSPTPRVWLGYVGRDGMGLRADYWQFNQTGDSRSVRPDGLSIVSAGAHATTVIFPATILAAVGETLTATDALETHIVNMEGTLHRDLGWISFVGGGGIRYVSLKQTLSSFVNDAVPDNLSWLRRYEGIGPTVSVDAKRQIGQTGLSFIAGGGGALLFGHKNLNRVATGNDVFPTGAVSPLLVLDDADEVVGTGELSLGAEWTRTFASGATLTVKGTYEAQLWAEAGAPTLGFLGFEGYGIQLELRL